MREIPRSVGVDLRDGIGGERRRFWIEKSFHGDVLVCTPNICFVLQREMGGNG